MGKKILGCGLECDGGRSWNRQIVRGSFPGLERKIFTRSNARGVKAPGHSLISPQERFI